jgi:hypothetical protein
MTAKSLLFFFGTGIGAISHAVAAEKSAPIDFNRDIRPILSENCFHCHGPDANKREGDLRLDVEADAKRDLGGYFALKPGDPANSTVWERLNHEDPDELMPPAKSKRVLTTAQKDLLRRWIEAGAPYQAHWAYAAPKRPEAPALARKELSARVTNDIDRFVFERLESEGLAPAPEADRPTLIRRASLDLTGLPPTPEEVAAFVEDKADGAWERVLDRLLKSDRFGEHWARPWLDLARYADSNGFQADQYRDSWAYRDWVIDALNANMPFDRFTIEQLAGDLLPDATTAQKIATGFHRTVTCNVEAGVHPEENRVNQVVDRVNTTGTVWLGSTLECAQCHDHKYDPFTMKDYYRMFAYFNNTPLEVENKSGKGVQFEFYGPKMELSLDGERQAKYDDLKRQVASLKTLREALTAGGAKDRTKQEAALLASAGQGANWTVLKPETIEGTGGETFEMQPDGSILAKGKVPDKTTYSISAWADLPRVRAIRIEALTHDAIPGKGPGRGQAERPNIVVNEIRLFASSDGGEEEEVKLGAATASFAQANFAPSQAVDGNGATAWAIAPQFGKPHWITIETAEPMEAKNGAPRGMKLRVEIVQNFGSGRVIGCVRLSATDGDPSAESLPEELTTILKKPAAKRNAKEKKTLDDYFAEKDPELSRLDKEISAAEAELKKIQPPTTLVMVEMPESRETHIMTRGNYLSPAEKVVPGTPETLHPLDPALPANRLGLAKWLVDPKNPLVARVTVNRWWAGLFGTGIVRTAEDFGTQSEPPTHADLLDWLAVEFVESGWDMKHVLRTILMSSTYRQDSRLTDALARVDPENRLLARGARFRLSAEAIRDNGLTVSGLLSSKMHGPPVMPYQPPNIWRTVGRNEPKWIEAADENRWRRGIYVIWRRAAPYPSFVNFDGPDRGSCVVDRPRTNTPLQALTLLNDPAYAEMAMALAERILTEKAPDRISRAFTLVLGRPAADAERVAISKLLDRRLAMYEKDAAAAKAVIEGARGHLNPSAELSPAELAAWFFVANALLNLDETVTKG